MQVVSLWQAERARLLNLKDVFWRCNMGKKLVAYFSASGATRNVASALAEVVEADLFEIKPAVPYTNEDLDWKDKNSRSSVEMHNPDSRPEVAEKLENMDEYDTIFVGFPIWWYIAPTIINTFFESYDFNGKTIVVFATSGGSGFGKTVENLKNSCPGAIIKEGMLFNSGVDKTDLKVWADKVI